MLTAKKPNRLKGMKLRDEFVCPITFEVMSDPVVASDGHTYEKSAIEKWLKTSSKSPRNGEVLTKQVIPNLNMKKLIQDLIEEGGSGLYTIDISDKSRLFDVYPEKIIIMKCLGPPESDWNGRDFQVTPYGCMGGRKVVEPPVGREVVAFRDSTVSRKHFEIMCDATTKKYQIRDVGSAGGTFIRIPYGEKRELHPGMMLLIGKHQFTVSSIDSTSHIGNNPNNSMLDTKLVDGDTIHNLVNDAHKLIESISSEEKQLVSHSSGSSNDLNAIASPHGSGGKPAIDEKLKLLSSKMNHLLMMSHGQTEADSKSESPLRKKQNIGMTSKNADNINNLNELMDMNEQKYGDDEGDANSESDAKCNENPSLTHMASQNASKKCTITCFAPDGSPLQGQSFIVDMDGAVIGRKVGCKIPLYITQEPEESKSVLEFPSPQDQKVINIDTAVSSEHARIAMDEKSGKFYVLDGTLAKPSTNGTWVRLSGPFQESPYTTVNTSTELLIGTVRFYVSETMTILEKVVTNTSTTGSMQNTPNIVKVVDT